MHDTGCFGPFPLLIFAAAKFRGRILEKFLEVQQQMSAP